MTVHKDWAPDLFGYLDYRAFLRDYYESAKAHTSYMSFRYLSRQAGFSSPNYVKLVMDGARNLSDQGAGQVADALGLRGEGRRFWGDLVQFTQSDDPDVRTAAFERLGASTRFKAARGLDQAVFEYLSRWYYPAIREMIARADFDEDPAWIAGQLLPSITPEQAAEALETMLRMGLLVRGESGRLEHQEANLSTGHEVQQLSVGNYHRQMLERASESIRRVPSSRRYLSATTMCISEAQFDELRAMIYAWRERIIERAGSGPDASTVYQFNVQLFPLSQTPERG